MRTADALDPNETLQWMRDSFVVYPEIGQLIWDKPTKYHPDLLGTSAGSARPTHSNKKYVHIKKDRRAVKRGWLIFLWVNGRWPEPELDHHDGDSMNDAIWNLREATDTQNAWNHKSRKKKSALPMGVRKLKRGGFQARIAKHGKSTSIGTFATAELARAAYLQKREEVFGEFA